MAEQILRDCKVYFGGYDLSARHNKVDLNHKINLLESTVFGDSSVTRKAGLLDTDASGQGFWQTGVGEIDEVLFDKVGVHDQVISICPTDGAVGELVYTFPAVNAKYAPGAAIGELLGFAWAANAQQGYPLARGIILGTGNKTATGTGAAQNIGALAAGQILMASLHVMSVAGTGTPTITVAIESDDNSGFTSAIERVAFTAATAIGSQWAVPILGDVGPITDTYWRAKWTVSGTNPVLKIAVSLAIQAKN